MPLIPCGECQKPISDRAGICPNCGCPTGIASVRERFEQNIAMMKSYRDEIERRIATSATLLAGVVVLLLGSPAARDALAREIWLLFLMIATIAVAIGVHIWNVFHWLKRWRDIRDNTDRLNYMDADHYTRYRSVPHPFRYILPVALLGLFILVCIVALGVGYIPVEVKP